MNTYKEIEPKTSQGRINQEILGQTDKKVQKYLEHIRKRLTFATNIKGKYGEFQIK
jgi:hypothetical protein